MAINLKVAFYCWKVFCSEGGDKNSKYIEINIQEKLA